MTRLKLLLLLVILAFNKVTSKCTASQSNKMMKCSALFFDSLGFYNDDDPDPFEIMFSLTNSWSNVEKFCGNFEELSECLGPSVIANCVDLKKDVKSMSDYIDFGFGFLYTAGNYVCGDGYETLKNMYSCGLSECKIDDRTCQTIKNSIDDCFDAAKLKCDKKDSIFLNTILNIRECFKNPDCGLCGDEATTQRVKEYHAKMNVGKKEKNNILKEFSKAAQSDDVNLQLDAITNLRKQLSGKKISKDAIVKEGYLPIFVKYLSSKRSGVQAEAASALKYLIDETPENLEAILESEIIPALIRTLISTDENVLKRVIETLATIISKHPSLRNLYMDLNIVESLLMSYSPEMYYKIKVDMVTILVRLLKNDVLTLSSDIQKYTFSMLPALSELIYSFDSHEIVSFINDIFVTRVSDRADIIIDVDIVDKVYQLLFHQDKLIRQSAFFIISIFPKREKLVQRLFENEILKFIKNEFKDDKTDINMKLSALLFLAEIAQNQKNNVQPLFDADLIPSMISFLNPKHNAGLRMLTMVAFHQISKHGTSTQISTLVDLNIIPKICEMLQYSFSKYDSDDYDDEQDAQMGAILTIDALSENNQKALLQFKENNGKEIVQQFVTRKDLKLVAFTLLNKLEMVDDINDEDDVDQNDRDRVVNEGLFSNFVKNLSSKSSKVQAEAASAIKYLIDETPENFEAILEAEIIPALIRTLISKDENVWEKVIETLATIISKHPSLRNTYMDLYIVESLLMSYSLDMSAQMRDDMVRILIYLSINDVETLSSKTEKYTSSMLPVLSKLIYNFDSKAVVSFIENILISRFSDRADIIIDVDIVDKVYQFLFHQDELIRQSAFFIISIFPKREKLVQRLFENGILEFIKNEFKDDNIDSPLKYSGFLFLTEVAQNNKHIQAIFDAGLIPSMISFLNPKHEAGLRMVAMAALCKITRKGTSVQHEIVVDFNIIPKISQMLQYSLSKYSSVQKFWDILFFAYNFFC